MSLLQQFNVNNLPIGSLLKTKNVMRLGVFPDMYEDEIAIDNLKREIPLAGFFIIISEQRFWSSLTGYKILTHEGTRWLIWTMNSAFGQWPERYVEKISVCSSF